MVALAVDEEVFFSTSIKKGHSYVYKDECDQDDKSQFRDNLPQVPGVKQLQDFLTQCM